jgi:hypothetical protein
MPYLKKVKDNYHVFILGKNGEPLAKQNVSLSMTHRIKGQTNRHHTTKKLTNKQGAVNLGQLIDVTNLKVEAESGARAQWDLHFQSS